MLEDEFVNRVSQKKDFVAFFHEALEVRGIHD
jgi:hypothetical protein